MKVNETGFSVMKICVELIIKTCGIIAICTLFVVPWTSIHRVDSIIYKNSWKEPNLPVTINWMIRVGADILNLTVWTGEDSLKSFNLYFKLTATCFAAWLFLYVSSYLLWSICLGFNYQLPYLALILVPTWLISNVGFWFYCHQH